MAKIAGFVQKVFGKNATNIGQIGSAAAGTKVLTTDPATIQALTAFTNGISDVTLTSKHIIPQEEFMALHYLHTLQNAYAQQEGIQEYNSEVTYYQNSIVKKSGTYELYGSLIDDNIGNALASKADTAYWKYLGDLNSIVLSSSISGISGYLLLANKSDYSKPLKFQWQQATISGAVSQTFSFYSAFSNKCFHVFPTDIGASSTPVGGLPKDSGGVDSLTQFTLYLPSSGTKTCSVWSVGY